MNLTFANQHRLAREGEPVRFAAPGETVRLAPGAYLTSVGIGTDEARRVANLAHGIGALDANSYRAVLHAIDVEGDDNGDLALELVDQLNAAALSEPLNRWEAPCWAFVDGELHCEPASWYWDVSDEREDGRAAAR